MALETKTKTSLEYRILIASCVCSIGLCERLKVFNIMYLLIIYFSLCSTNICVFCWVEYFILSWFWHATSKIKLQFKAEHNFKSSNFKGWDFAFVIFSYHNFCLEFSLNFHSHILWNIWLIARSCVLKLVFVAFSSVLSKHLKKLILICNKKHFLK